MPLIQPFRALRPAPARAAEVLAPPYDVLSSAEARARASGKPFSFLHISKPEIDLDPSVNPYDAAGLRQGGGKSQAHGQDAGVLMRDTAPCYYVYRLTWHGQAQTGLACVASLADYATNRIRKHELTTPVKEDDRVRQIEAVNAQTGPVMIGYPNAPAIDALLAKAAAGKPAVDVTADDGVRHQLWVIGDDSGDRGDHHALSKRCRPSTSPTAITARRPPRALPPAARATGSHSYFLSVIFPEREMTILDYNRVVKDLNGRAPEQFLAELRKSFTVAASDKPVRPAASNEYGMYLVGRWYRLSLHPDLIPKDPIGRLPITLLTRNVIEPLLGIADPRTDKRIDFIGGARGLEGLRGACQFRRDGSRLRALSDADARSDGGGRRRRHHAAEIDLVRAQARRRHGQSRARLTKRGYCSPHQRRKLTAVAVGRYHQQHHRLLAGLLELVDALLQVGRGRDRLLLHLGDHHAGREVLLGRRRIRIDRGDHHALHFVLDVVLFAQVVGQIGEIEAERLLD